MRARKLVAIIGAFLVVLGGTAFVVSNSDTRAVAIFHRTTGLYPGDDVRVLGVTVGSVDAIHPQGMTVRVDFHYDDVEIPAEAKAAIVAPTLISARYLQLTPAHSGGPALADGAEIPLPRTAVPVEWDELKGQLNELGTALGPQGANREGALSEALDAGAANLNGQGANLHQAIDGLSRAMTTIDNGRDDVFGTVRNLQTFVSALSTSDAQIREFNGRLSSVSQTLNSNSQELATALHSLTEATGSMNEFLRTHADEITHDTASMAQLTRTVVSQRDNIENTLHLAPHALSNGYHTYNARTGAYSAALSLQQLQNPAQLVCSTLSSLGAPEQTCHQAAGPLLDLLAIAQLPIAANPLPYGELPRIGVPLPPPDPGLLPGLLPPPSESGGVLPPSDSAPVPAPGFDEPQSGLLPLLGAGLVSGGG